MYYICATQTQRVKYKAFIFNSSKVTTKVTAEKNKGKNQGN